MMDKKELTQTMSLEQLFAEVDKQLAIIDKEMAKLQIMTDFLCKVAKVVTNN